MSIKGEWIKYKDQRGYIAVPEKAELPVPGVIVIAELYGVNEQIEDVSRRIAAAGYTALAPDFFAVNGERPEPLKEERVKEAMIFMRKAGPAIFGDPAKRAEELAKLPRQEGERIGETLGVIYSGMSNMDKYIGILKSGAQYLRHENPGTKDQKVACVGFCMGGGLSALLACEEPEISGAAVFYGQAPAPDKISKINCPVIAFYGGNDQRVNAGIPGFESGMKQAGKTYEHYIYEGVNHGFFNDDNPSYNVKAVRDSYAKLLNFFLKTLTGKEA